MKIYGVDGREMMAVTSIERRGSDLVIKGKLFGVMPITAKFAPAEAHTRFRLPGLRSMKRNGHRAPQGGCDFMARQPWREAIARLDPIEGCKPASPRALHPTPRAGSAARPATASARKALSRAAPRR